MSENGGFFFQLIPRQKSRAKTALGICRGGLELHFYQIRYFKDGLVWQKTTV
jgi:hypothetical protein